MKQIVKCCLAVVLGFTVAGCSKGSSGGSGGGGSGKLQEHKKVQLWEDGPYWAETNIGAEKPWDYGYYFWWGDTIGYKRVNDAWVASDGSSFRFSFDWKSPGLNKNESTLRKEGWINADGVLEPSHDAAHVHWGGEWRMPTDQELKDLRDKCDWAWFWKYTNGVSGYVVRGRGDYASASIFLPAAGYGNGTTRRVDGFNGVYWSSVLELRDTSSRAWFLAFHASRLYILYNTGRFDGNSIRPVQGSRKGQTPLTQ